MEYVRDSVKGTTHDNDSSFTRRPTGINNTNEHTHKNSQSVQRLNIIFISQSVHTL